MGSIKLKNIMTNAETNDSIVAQPETAQVETESINRNMPEEDWNDPAVLEEDSANITENSRHYKMNNGTEKSIVSAMPVNYFDEESGKWERIDNSLTEKEDCFEGKIGKFKAEVSKVHKGKAVKVSQNNLSVSWEYLGKGNSSTENIQRVATFSDAAVPETVLNVEKQVNGVSEIDKSSKAVYKNAETNTDLEYNIQGNNIKENIIVRECAEEYKYRFALNTAGLKLRLSEDNTNIELYSETTDANGEKIEKREFMIPSPFMYDANGERNDDVYYEIEPEIDGKYVFSVVANAEWINAEERALPVIIDPQIVTEGPKPFFTYAVYRRNYNCGMTSSGTNNQWVQVNYNGIIAGVQGCYEYRTTLTINKNNIVRINCKK